MVLSYSAYVEKNPRYKWYLTLALLISSMMTELNYLIVPVGMPKVMSSLGATVDSIQWVMVGYLIASTVTMGSMGYLGEVLGYKRLYLICVALFTASSGLCGMAWNVESLVLFRLLQGLGGGAIWPLGVAILVETFSDEERGTGLGIFSTGATFIPYALGPSLGGYLLEYLNWRIMFLINVPLGIVGFVLVSTFMREIRSGAKLRFDFVGFSTLMLSMVSFLLALSEVDKLGWNSTYIMSLLFISSASFLVFLITEFKVKIPFFDLKLFKYYNFTFSMIIMILYGVTFYASSFFLPILVVNILDFSVLQLGMMMVPGSILSSILLLTSGWLSDRWDSRIFIGLGIILGFFSMLMYATVSFQTGTGTIIIMMVFRGAGAGLLFIPLTKVAMRGIPARKVGMASGYLTLLLVIGGSFGIAMFSTILQKRIAFHSATNSELLDIGSTGFDLVFSKLKGFMLHAGFADGTADSLSYSLIGGFASSKTIVQAYNDIFLLGAAATLLVLIPVIIMKKN